MPNDKIIYRLNDRISFRKCSLWDEDKVIYGDCTNFSTKEVHWTEYYSCNQMGIHLHCTKHPEIELRRKTDDIGTTYYVCDRCGEADIIEIDNEHALQRECLRMLNIPEFKGAKLIRLDDYYVPEIKAKKKDESGYWMTADVKTAKDGDTMIVLYVGHKDSNEKAQFFIKPEKGQLASDHKDMDPAKVLSKIEVTFKGRKITQEYGDEEV